MNNQTILHLGSGKCSELERYLTSDAKKIVLVEANFSIVAALQKIVGDLNHVEIFNFAVSDKENGKLNVFNLIDASSLHKPAGLLDLFPGLQTIREIDVNVKTASEIVSDMGLDKNEDNLLVIDIPGEEFNVIKNLQESNLLHLFSQLHLHCGVSSLYQDAKSGNEILEYLKTLGYDLSYQEWSKDPEFPCWILQLNTLLIENNDLKAQLNHLKQEQAKQIDENKIVFSRLTQESVTQVKLANDELGKVKEREGFLTNELVEARKTTSLSIKLQTLKDADLRDLQKKYSEALTVQDNQHQLLTKLSERLSIAAKYFHQISENQHFINEERKVSDQTKPKNPKSVKKN